MGQIALVENITANNTGAVIVGGRAYKLFNEKDPNFFRARGHMFTLPTRGANSAGTIFDYNFAGDGTKYPNNANGYPNGKQMLWGGTAITGRHGVYIAPGAHKVAYISEIIAFYNHNAKNLFEENYKETGGVLSGIEFNHSGSVYCDRFSAYGISLIAEGAPQEVVDAIATGNYLYSQKFPLATPGRFDGDAGESFGLHTRGGGPIYLGTSLAANKLTTMHFAFVGWVVDKIDVGGGSWQEVIAL